MNERLNKIKNEKLSQINNDKWQQQYENREDGLV